MRAVHAVGWSLSSLLVIAGCSADASRVSSKPSSGNSNTAPADTYTPYPAGNTYTPAPTATTTPAANCHLSYVTVADPQPTNGATRWAFSQTTPDPSILVLAANGNGNGNGNGNVFQNQAQQPSDPFAFFFGELGGIFGFGDGSDFGNLPQGQGATATVTDQRTTPHTLVLTADQPTQWNVTAVAPTAIQKIVTVGFDVSVSGPAGVPIAHADNTISTDFSADVDRDPIAADLRSIAGQVGEIAIANASSTFTIAATATQHCSTRTPEVAPGTPMTWNTNGTAGLAANNMLTVSQGQSGSFTGSTLRDHGKFYFEAQILDANHSSSALGVSNVPDPNNPDAQTDGCTFSLFGSGFCGFAPNQDVRAIAYAAGSRVGFAVDLDNGQIFMQVNGAWSPTPPAASGGFPIARLTPMAPVANLRSGDQVQMVFDAASLKTPAPAGFTAGW